MIEIRIRIFFMIRILHYNNLKSNNVKTEICKTYIERFDFWNISATINERSHLNV